MARFSRKAKFGKVWRSHGRKWRYAYSGKFSQWRKKQVNYGRGWIDFDDGWSATPGGEFRRKYQ
jgi:hypothetical protein